MRIQFQIRSKRLKQPYIKTMPILVLITTSGTGSRLGETTKYINKALVRVGSKPVISHIIDRYPSDTEFVITIGYCGELVRDYIKIAYQDRSVRFVEVDNYEGPGSSLLYSLLCAKPLLQKPFVFHACDTITLDMIPPPTRNWIAGFAGRGSSEYASFSVLGSKVTQMHNKGDTESDFLHVGLIGISTYQEFWAAADTAFSENGADSSLGDVDVLKRLVKVANIEFIGLKSWYDIGNLRSLEATRKAFNDNSFHVLDKDEESIFKLGDSIIKFFRDKKTLNNRVARVKYLNKTVPDITGVEGCFYKYKYVDGELFSNKANRSNIGNLLKWAESKLWTKVNGYNRNSYKEKCYAFYNLKTIKRLNDFWAKKSIVDKADTINGEVVPPVKEMFDQIDVAGLSAEDPSGFHGDFILDNIIKTDAGEYKLIDWRQDFGGEIAYGDKHYDLAKLSHSLVLNHGIIDQNHFTVDIGDDGNVNVNIHRLQTLVDCEEVLSDYLSEKSIDVNKIKVLRSIIWLNMSPLHHHPLDLFLYYFGKYSLFRSLKRINNEI